MNKKKFIAMYNIKIAMDRIANSKAFFRVAHIIKTSTNNIIWYTVAEPAMGLINDSLMILLIAIQNINGLYISPSNGVELKSLAAREWSPKRTVFSLKSNDFLCWMSCQAE